MPNPTTSHDDEQPMTSLKVGGFRFHALPLSEHQRPHTPRMEVISSYENEYIDESEAVTLVAMILQIFPNIREQIKGSKP